MSPAPLSAPRRAALALAVALLTAAPAAADAVRWSHLGGGANARLASGPPSCAAESNVKRTSDLATEPWWGNDSSWNRYAYVQNNPLKYTDPDGEWAHIAIGAVVGAALNAGAKAIQNSAEGRPVTEGLGKAALVGAAGGAVTAATFGMGAALLTGGGAAGAIATLSSTASIPTLTATGGLIVGGTSAGLGGAVTGAGNEAVVQGNTNFQDVASAAATSGLKSVPLGALLGAAGAGPVTEAVAGEVSTVADAAYQYVAKELADSLAPEEETE